jgi:phage minor structural protein
MMPILYESDERTFEGNGICRLSDCISCEVTEERNGVYECDFEYPVTGAYFDQITPGRIIACTHEDSNDIQPFDIVSYERTLDKVVKFHAVHVSYRLRQKVAFAPIASYSSVTDLDSAIAFMNNNATQQSGELEFTIATDKENTTAYASAFDGTPRTVRELMGGVEGSLIDTFGGEWLFDKWTATLTDARGEEKDFVVRYGFNMTEYSEETDFTDTYATVVPFWKKEENDVVTIVYADVVDTGLSDYGDRKSCVPLDLSEKYQNQPTVAQLQNAATKYIKSNKPNEPYQSITVDFMKTDEPNISDLMKCNLCDTILVILPTYGIEREFKIVKTSYDVLNDRYNSMELGALSLSLGEVLK